MITLRLAGLGIIKFSPIIGSFLGRGYHLGLVAFVDDALLVPVLTLGRPYPILGAARRLSFAGVPIAVALFLVGLPLLPHGQLDRHPFTPILPLGLSGLSVFAKRLCSLPMLHSSLL